MSLVSSQSDDESIMFHAGSGYLGDRPSTGSRLEQDHYGLLIFKERVGTCGSWLSNAYILNHIKE